MSVTLPTPVTLARAEHPVSRKQISKIALRVLYKLLEHDHEAYLVGGGVRDLLLGREPKDFDVTTSAHPEQIKALFKKHCRLIGRRFILAHVQFGDEIIEVATFRRALDASRDRPVRTRPDRLLSDNIYGTLPEDALRRDFSINSLYYNPKDFTVLDFHGGIQDLHYGLIRVIGDPETRFREDPVRMLRAVRFAAKLGFRIEAQCEAALRQWASLLQGVPPARLYDECQKLFLHGFGLEAFEKLRHYGLFAPLFPDVEASLTQQQANFPRTFLAHGLRWLDRRWQAGLETPPAWMMALLWWEPAQQLVAAKAGCQTLFEATQILVSRQAQQHAAGVPSRIIDEIRSLWLSQARLTQARLIQEGASQNADILLGHPLFAQAWQFLALRAQAGEVDPALVAYWREMALKHPGGRRTLAEFQTGAFPERAITSEDDPEVDADTRVP